MSGRAQRVGQQFGKLIGIAVSFGLAGAVWSYGTRAETLQDALVRVYQNNPTLLAERARLRATDEGVSTALSGWRPTVQIDGDAGFSETETTTDSAGIAGITDSSLQPSSFSISITEPLYRGGRTTAEMRSARKLVDGGRAALMETEQRVLLNSVNAYMEVLRSQSVLDLNRHNEGVVKYQLKAARDRFEVGEVTRTDVAQAEARLAQAVADRIGAEGDLISSRATYRQFMGDLPGTLVWPEPLGDLPESEREALEKANNFNPAIHSAEFKELSAQDEIDVTLSNLLPQVSLRGAYDWQYDVSSAIEELETLSLTALVSVPLYQSGAEYSAVRRSKQIAGQRRLEYIEARRAIFEEVTRAWEALITARAKIVALEAQVRAAEIALEGVKQETMVGLRTTLDVLNAEQEVLAARINLVGAERDEVFSSCWVLVTIGGFTAEALSLSVDHYDAEAHYHDVRDKWFGTGPE